VTKELNQEEGGLGSQEAFQIKKAQEFYRRGTPSTETLEPHSGNHCENAERHYSSRKEKGGKRGKMGPDPIRLTKL